MLTLCLQVKQDAEVAIAESLKKQQAAVQAVEEQIAEAKESKAQAEEAVQQAEGTEQVCVLPPPALNPCGHCQQQPEFLGPVDGTQSPRGNDELELSINFKSLRDFSNRVDRFRSH